MVQAEDNTRLVHHALKSFDVPPQDYDDWFQTGCVGLVKAANSFDSSKGYKFATYAMRCIANELLMQFRHKRVQMISMDEPVSTDKEGNVLIIEDLLMDEDNTAAVTEIRLDEILQFIPSNWKYQELYVEYLTDLMIGNKVTQRAYCKKYHLSQSYVSRLITRLQLHLGKCLKINEYV